jgi:hypothetical protein
VCQPLTHSGTLLLIGLVQVVLPRLLTGSEFGTLTV